MHQDRPLAEVVSLCKTAERKTCEYHDLVKLIKRLCEGNGLQLTSDDDIRELNRVTAENKFVSLSHTEQLLSDGIAIRDGRVACRKAWKNDLVWSHIEEGDLHLHMLSDNMEALIKPNNLSPVGATLLSWVLVPSPSNAEIFMRILGMAGFANCLVHFIQGKDLPSTSSPIVMPMGWLYWLNLPDDFVRDHVEFFNLAVSVAKPFLKKGAKDNPKSEKAKSSRSSEDSREKNAKGKSASDDLLGRAVASKSSSSSDDARSKSMSDSLMLTVEDPRSRNEDSKSKWKDALSKRQVAQRRPGKVKGMSSDSKKKGRGRKSDKGVLLLDQNNRLTYMPNIKSVPKWETTGVSWSAEAFGSSVGGGYSRQRNEFHSEAQKLLFSGHVVQFHSLSHFMRFDFGDSVETDPVNRMKWLKSILDRKAVFPRGVNQCFLTAMTGDSHLNTHVTIFPDSDCRITLNSLNHHTVYQDKEHEPENIYFQTQDRPGYYKAACMEAKSGLHLISQVLGPETLEDDSNLHRISKDLG